MRDPRDRLHDILHAIEAIQASVEGQTRSAFIARFDDDAEFADALSYRLIVIGEGVAALLSEAARRPVPWLQSESAVDWSGWIGLRNVVAHQYFRRDSRKVWETVRELPAFRRTVAAALAAGGEASGA